MITTKLAQHSCNLWPMYNLWPIDNLSYVQPIAYSYSKHSFLFWGTNCYSSWSKTKYQFNLAPRRAIGDWVASLLRLEGICRHFTSYLKILLYYTRKARRFDGYCSIVAEAPAISRSVADNSCLSLLCSQCCQFWFNFLGGVQFGFSAEPTHSSYCILYSLILCTCVIVAEWE